MSEEREPIRLRDDPTEPPGLRAMLDAASGETASDAMLERVLAGVLAAGGGGGGSGGGGATVGKIAGAIGASVVGAGIVAWIATTVQPSVVEPPPRSITISMDAAISVDASNPIDAAPIDVGLDAFVVVRVDRHRPIAPPSTVGETDGELMMRVTREHDPARSLALAREHRERFPESAYAEDREARIVEDLAALRRAAEANAAAEAFRAQWPHSAHLPHMDAALARMRAP